MTSPCSPGVITIVTGALVSDFLELLRLGSAFIAHAHINLKAPGGDTC